MKPDWCPQDVWDAAFGFMDEHVAEAMLQDDGLEQSVQTAIARAILSATKAENDALPDEIDLYQMLKRSGLRKRADIAKFIATAIRQRSEKQ